MDNRQKLKKILDKASSMGVSANIAKEFIAIEDSISSTKDEIVGEIKNIPEVPPFPKIPHFPEFPIEVSIGNLPDVQQVEVLNFPEQKAPIVNVEPVVRVEAPVVNVGAPILNVDTEKLEKSGEETNKLLSEISSKLDNEETVEIQKVLMVDENGKPKEIVVSGVGGISKYITNQNGDIVNPSTEVLVEDKISMVYVNSHLSANLYRSDVIG